MKLLSNSSYSALVFQRDHAQEQNKALRRRVRELEANYQTLVLRLGLRGLTVEFQPEVPAKPATLVLREARR